MNIADEQKNKLWKELMERAGRAIKFGNLEKAEELLLDAYQQCKNTYGSDHGTVGLVLLKLSDVCEQLGKTHMAAQYKTEIERILQSYQMDQDHCDESEI